MSKKHLPRLPLRFFRWYCHPEYLEDLEGDLLERFEKRRLGKGAKVARWALFWDVLRLFRPGIIRTFGDPQQLNSCDMFKNNLKVSARSLMKRKEYSFVNVMGIAVGVTSALLISLFVQDELSHDRFFTDADRIYKMVAGRQKEGAYEWDPKVAYSFTRSMAQDYAQVESATAIAGPYHSEPITVVKDDDRNVSFLENSGYYADGNFFLVFSFKLLRGNPKTALREPNSVVLTKSMAQKYFGNDEPLGKSIFMNNRDFRVTGICEDPPPNSHFEFNYIGSSASISWFNLNHFNLATAHCYFKLQRGADPHALEREFPAMVKKYMPNAVEEAFGVSWEEYRKAGNRSRYYFKPLTSLHLDPGNLGGFKPGGSMTTVRILVAIAALIFIIACVNFINLAAARSMVRIHEIGVRKVIGATKPQLILRFFTESFILALVAVSIALASTTILLPYFNILIEKELVINFDSGVIWVLMGSALVITVFSGAYPAWVLSSFKPITALKGRSNSNLQGKRTRNGLVAFQFCISVVVITVTLVIHQQLIFLLEKDLGFDKEQIIVIQGTNHRDPGFIQPFLNAVEDISQVQSGAGSYWVQEIEGENFNGYRLQGSDQMFTTTRAVVGDGFSEVMGYELLEGQFFSRGSDDSHYVMINESAVKFLGLENPLGKKIIQETLDGEIEFTIKGVVKDFHYQTLHEHVKPLVIQSTDRYRGRAKYILVKIKPGGTQQALAQLEAAWEKLVPDRPFNFKFLDQTLDTQYNAEQRLGKVFFIFSGLGIFIACIGLFSISAYTISLRTKEIGIRKVVGASVKNILVLLSKDLIKVMGLAFLLAAPIAWIVLRHWLEDFAYRITLTPFPFTLAGMFTGIMAWLTVSVQTLKAAKENPVDCLKDE